MYEATKFECCVGFLGSEFIWHFVEKSAWDIIVRYKQKFQSKFENVNSHRERHHYINMFTPTQLQTLKCTAVELPITASFSLVFFDSYIPCDAHLTLFSRVVYYRHISTRKFSGREIGSRPQNTLSQPCRFSILPHYNQH